MAERLIDEKELREKLYEWCGNHCNNSDGCQYCKVSEIIDIVEDAPTIEAKPVVHAHWESTSSGRHVCSNCHCRASYESDEYDYYEDLSDYCHICGAQMDEVASDTNVGSKGVKIPVISMEDVPKLMREGD